MLAAAAMSSVPEEEPLKYFFDQDMNKEEG